MKAATFAFTTPNLGDDVQALAALVHLPHIDRFVDRDSLAWTHLAEPHFIVMNSWFQKRSKPFPRPLRPPSSSFAPLFHGFCVSRPSLLNRQWRSYLEKHQPIGTRDTWSAGQLSKYSINGIWAGCLTAYLGRAAKPVPQAERRGIVFVDVPADAEKTLVPDALRARAIRISNFSPKAIEQDPLERLNQIAKICDVLRHAELVVTRRLHTALPCVGFRTPVFVVLESKPGNIHRFSGFDSFLPMVLYGDGTTPHAIDWNDRTPAVIPAALDERFAGFLARVDATLGSHHAAPADSLATNTRIVMENPGLGEKPGEIEIDLGIRRVRRTPTFWSERQIVLDLPSFAGFERFSCPLRIRGYGAREWLTVGPVSDAIKASQAPDARLTPALKLLA